ncbi:MAG: hypothetical protein HP496_02570, partial [Nitrospira sp.]|nr:hypothetical protein [Nitrospira sp.]
SLAMAKPIILGVEGESADLLRAAKAGVCIEPEQADDLAAQVLELSQHPERCRELGQNGRHYVTEHFDRIVLAGKLAAVLEIVGGRTVRETETVSVNRERPPVNDVGVSSPLLVRRFGHARTVKQGHRRETRS